MEADFSGYATKAGLKCSDGRTIMPDAFKHQDTTQVPLVWQHGHTDPENVLGHAILENRPDGVYAYAFFNNTAKAKHAQELVHHKDINQMSIWANELVEKAKRVLHGAICEVSLVLKGANPGALIDNVTVRHADGDTDVLDDEAIIYTGLAFELGHSGVDDGSGDKGKVDTTTDKNKVNTTTEKITTAELTKLYESMSDDQKQLVHAMMQPAADGGDGDGSDTEDDSDTTLQDVYDSMSPEQQQFLHYMVGEAIASVDTSAQHDALGGNNDDSKGNGTMNNGTVKHNVFEQDGKDGKEDNTLSHDAMKAIFADAMKGAGGSLKEAVETYALAHGIENIDVLFPEAQAISNAPELFSRRQEWVQKVMDGVNKTPFARIKTLSADITVQEARAKGYIKGSLKKEEFFKALKRVTTPTTIYKKQKLDRDDMIDITDFDVVAWLKGEMRLMLDEELARAVLVGDGRLVDDEDKVNEDCIRPIATDSEVYVTRVKVNIDDANSTVSEIFDAIMMNRQYLRGSGMPTMYTTETYIAKFLTLRDTLGRRIYTDLNQVALELRVNEIVPVPVLAEYPNIIAILVNPTDYTVGANQGGQVSLFDFFDIDYNQYKYLIETRCSGALTKLKSAMVVEKVAANAVAVVPAAPDFDGSAITINDQTGVVYRNATTDAVMNNAGSPYAVPADTDVVVRAEEADDTHYFPSTANDMWTFRNEG